MNSRQGLYHLDLGDPGLGGQGCFSDRGTQREVSRVESGKGVRFQEVHFIPRFCRTFKKEIKKIMGNGFV